MTTTTTTTKAQPIPEFPLICNGDLNPLARNWDDLQRKFGLN